MSTDVVKKCVYAFVSSSFGFGPVSKAATIAGEIKRRSPSSETHFFGSGIALQFAQQAKVFDQLIEADVDEKKTLEKMLPELRRYEIVFSVLNLPLLPLWRTNFGRLFFVDSLAWMWEKPPAGIENADIYFVQDYLVSPERIEKWKQLGNLILIPPIGVQAQKLHSKSAFDSQDKAKRSSSKTISEKRRNRLLVNFSGCSNPFVDAVVYEKYVATLLPIILEEAENEFEEIQVCVNRDLAEILNERYVHEHLKIGQLPHDEFLKKLADSRFLLTAPGITTTLEAAASSTPFGFLLPQNDSQAMMSEMYRRQFDENLTMAFSRFDERLSFPLSLNSFANLTQPIDLAVERLCRVLEIHQNEIRRFTTLMLKNSVTDMSESLASNIHQSWIKTGQTMIVDKM